MVEIKLGNIVLMYNVIWWLILISYFVSVTIFPFITNFFGLAFTHCCNIRVHLFFFSLPTLKERDSCTCLRRVLNFNCLFGDFFNAFFIAFVTAFSGGNSMAFLLPLLLLSDSSSESETCLELTVLDEPRFSSSFFDVGFVCCFCWQNSSFFFFSSSLTFTNNDQISPFTFSPFGPLSLNELTVKLRNCFSFLGTFSNIDN
mmetsp:Transcript_44183/g.94064  ORF Transcript_44183/g.94064 Transcript_44183/m.94064 type:complete len:201 (+) Transcript_44183:51-653(+)